MQTTKRTIKNTFVISDQYGITCVFPQTQDHAGTWRNARYDWEKSYYTYSLSFPIAGCTVKVEADTPLNLLNARRMIEADVMENGPDTFWTRPCYAVVNNTKILEQPFITTTYERLVTVEL
ncbi:MAG: hypothetical protein WC734_06170 [Patescibacteria group bacterium]